jgi:DNA-binding transcriptional LysR family regulator
MTLDAEERLKGIATFVHVVEAGSFSLAANRLHQTRSAVGKNIARLEQRLGTRLFNRSTRRQSLTENGQAYFERCKRALAEIEAAEAALDENDRELVGLLRVSVPVQLGRHVVAPVLARLAATHPRLDVDMAFSDRVVDLLEEGFDLGVRLGTLRDSRTLAARSLGHYDYVVCASPQYLRRHGKPKTAAEFEQHIGIIYVRPGPEMPWLIAGSDGELQELRVRRKLRMDDFQAIVDAALAGAGLARLPRWFAEPHVRSGALRRVWDGAHSQSVEVHAVWPQTRYMPMKTRAAIDMLATEVPRRILVQ